MGMTLSSLAAVILRQETGRSRRRPYSASGSGWCRRCPEPIRSEGADTLIRLYIGQKAEVERGSSRAEH